MKTKILLLNFLVFAVIFTACNNANKSIEKENAIEKEQMESDEMTLDMQKTKKAIAILSAKSNSGITGMVTFTEKDGMVTMEANIKDATSGMHAIHIHEKGDCSAPDGKSAGGHWNPTNSDHGKWGKAPFHIGDIGNISVNDNGKGLISSTTDKWCISCDDANKNIIGKAIIVHQGSDDFSSQPSGAAGSRIGCGEIIVEEM